MGELDGRVTLITGGTEMGFAAAQEFYYSASVQPLSPLIKMPELALVINQTGDISVLCVSISVRPGWSRRMVICRFAS